MVYGDIYWIKLVYETSELETRTRILGHEEVMTVVTWPMRRQTKMYQPGNGLLDIGGEAVAVIVPNGLNLAAGTDDNSEASQNAFSIEELSKEYICMCVATREFD